MKFDKKRYIPVMLILLLFAAGSRIGAVSAKYVTERTLQSQVTFTAKLAEKMVLEEYKVSRTPKGDYAYETQPETNHYITVNSNSYVLMPGGDIVKKPYIQISQKTPIKAYLFLEIVGHQPGAVDNGVSYELTDAWKPADGITGKHMGTVYVYSDSTGPANLDETLTKENGFKNIDIIKEGKVYVSQKLEKDANLEIKKLKVASVSLIIRNRAVFLSPNVSNSSSS